jgi:pimeloyl-ACP methyl ester carboxylesterase
VPSLHIWGANDPLIGDTSAALVELFHPATREVVVWPGAHSLPATGPAAAAIVEFIGHWDHA